MIGPVSHDGPLNQSSPRSPPLAVIEMMLYPGYTHRVSGEQISPHMWNSIFRFLEANGVTPPE